MFEIDVTKFDGGGLPASRLVLASEVAADPDAVTVRAPWPNPQIETVVTVTPREHGVEITALVGAIVGSPDDEPPVEGFASFFLPTAAWDALRAVASAEVVTA